MREYWGKSLCFMLALGLVCASSAARADFVCQHLDDDHPGVTVRLTDFAELQPSLLDPGLPPSLPGSLFYEPRLPRSPRERFASEFMPDWDTYAASYSGRQIDGIDLTSLLADAPAMLGHFYISGMTFLAFDGLFAETDVPLAGATGRTQVGDNNKALTQDRIYMRYNHYSQALTADASQFIVGPDRRVFAVDTYTLGAEKTFCDGLWSLEARMPFAGQMDFVTPNFSVSGGRVGNLALILKRMIYLSEQGSVVAGLGVDVPTGSAAGGHVNLTRYMVRNKAVHLLPYLGFLHASENRFFVNGFIQLDVPVNGQPISTRDLLFGPSELGKFHEQTLLHLDLSLGRWLIRNPDARLLTGLAFLAELHYTTTMNDSDLVSGQGLFTDLNFLNPANHVDLLNLTVGLHTEWRNNNLLRVGGSFPLRSGTDRTFDAELQIQLERRF
jgi:hypothetical protein